MIHDAAHGLVALGVDVVHLAEDQEQVDKVLAVAPDRFPALRTIVHLESRGPRDYDDARLLSWEDFLEETEDMARFILDIRQELGDDHGLDAQQAKLADAEAEVQATLSANDHPVHEPATTER